MYTARANHGYKLTCFNCAKALHTHSGIFQIQRQTVINFAERCPVYICHRTRRVRDDGSDANISNEMKFIDCVLKALYLGSVGEQVFDK